MSKEKKVNSEKETRCFHSSIEIRAKGEGEESRTIEGYAFKFDKLSRNFGWFHEKIARSAMNSIDLSKEDVVALFNHKADFVLARTISNTLTLEVDDTGLKYRFEAPNTTIGNDLLEMVKRQDIQHSSFAFTVSEDSWEEDEQLGDIRTITKFKRLYDVSPVTHPAYLDTEVTAAKRSFEQFKNENKPKPLHGAIEAQLIINQRKFN
ncbi:HK97 family phage prohead protease [Xanthovirga aplysinae]|uniref:HK97 family phage prohead protease n=1 Tax=Xanthovirga aplysinae TaxID=2529853 RepID=UPI0012BC586D|nr:HK97 family phage prohead protease [Xanthovirga aplysinae]MTI32810.1 HK97 family phage prohead protease [Xanthovirga aplysinae]